MDLNDSIRGTNDQVCKNKLCAVDFSTLFKIFLNLTLT